MEQEQFQIPEEEKKDNHPRGDSEFAFAALDINEEIISLNKEIKALPGFEQSLKN